MGRGQGQGNQRRRNPLYDKVLGTQSRRIAKLKLRQKLEDQKDKMVDLMAEARALMALSDLVEDKKQHFNDDKCRSVLVAYTRAALDASYDDPNQMEQVEAIADQLWQELTSAAKKRGFHSFRSASLKQQIEIIRQAILPRRDQYNCLALDLKRLEKAARQSSLK